MDSSLSTGFSQGRVRGSAAQLPPYRTASQPPLGTSLIPALPGKEQRVLMILPLQYRFCTQPSCLVKISQALLLGVWAMGHFSATDIAMVARATQMRAGLSTFLQVPIFRDWDVAYCELCYFSLVWQNPEYSMTHCNWRDAKSSSCRTHSSQTLCLVVSHSM